RSAVARVIQDYPQVLAAKLEPLPPPPPPAPEIDLDELAKAAVQAVLALGLGGVAATTAAEANAGQRRGPREAREKINVVVNGRRTSVKVRVALLEQMRAAADDAAKLEPAIQRFVDEAPEDCANRSAWVEQRAAQFLVLQKLTPKQSAQH